MSRFVQRKDNEDWEVYSKVPFKIACCDCGLVHTFALVAGKKGTPISIAANETGEPRGSGGGIRKRIPSHDPCRTP